jgi:hypothetical protein
MRRPLLISLLLVALAAATAQSAQPRPRPYSGCGLLALSPEPGEERLTLALYEGPGVNRIAEREGSTLPRLAGSGSEPLVAVSARKAGWARLAYDEAGREAWIEPPRAWQYLTWQEFLPGRTVRLQPGMKKVYYALRSEPRETAAELGTLTRDQAVRILQVEDDWARLQEPSGWFRWRDGDGRLTLSVTAGHP